MLAFTKLSFFVAVASFFPIKIFKQKFIIEFRVIQKQNRLCC